MVLCWCGVVWCGGAHKVSEGAPGPQYLTAAHTVNISPVIITRSLSLSLQEIYFYPVEIKIRVSQLF